MAARDGEVSARRAARLLEVHERTVRAWCRAGRFRKNTTRVDAAGRYWILRSEVEAVMREAARISKEHAEAYERRRSG